MINDSVVLLRTFQFGDFICWIYIFKTGEYGANIFIPDKVPIPPLDKFSEVKIRYNWKNIPWITKDTAIFNTSTNLLEPHFPLELYNKCKQRRNISFIGHKDYRPNEILANVLFSTPFVEHIESKDKPRLNEEVMHRLCIQIIKQLDSLYQTEILTII